ncbi:hypothetical protein E2C01_077230 [Portunus trituberculatus]|uniref:Uncharacterized protein n=1 Tax=Portunus trituberculatus TaxID=210409 RepID=A0A5B7ILL8_PORTR|nr:hypothetical protein [Portunus trituberculatus]
MYDHVAYQVSDAATRPEAGFSLGEEGESGHHTRASVQIDSLLICSARLEDTLSLPHLTNQFGWLEMTSRLPLSSRSAAASGNTYASASRLLGSTCCVL